MGKIVKTVAIFSFKDKLIFYWGSLTVRDDICNNFFRLFDGIFVEFVELAPVGLVVHQFVDATVGVIERDPEGHDVVDINFSFNFHVYRPQGKIEKGNRFFKFYLSTYKYV